jgi:hypothetical protein
MFDAAVESRKLRGYAGKGKRMKKGSWRDGNKIYSVLEWIVDPATNHRIRECGRYATSTTGELCRTRRDYNAIENSK